MSDMDDFHSLLHQVNEVKKPRDDILLEVSH